MSLPAFQQVVGALIADRTFCKAVRENAVVALAGRDLSPREMRRLAAMARAPGMAVSGTLHRLNRLTPLSRCLPRTLTALGPMLPGLIDAFWRAYPETRLQFEEEARRFSAFVEVRTAAGVVVPSLAADMLAFETAACLLLFRSGQQSTEPPGTKGPARLHPLVSVVRFTTEPTVAFAGGTDGGPPGEYYVVLHAHGSELRVTAVPVAVGRILALAQKGADVAENAACRSARAAGWLLG